MINKGDKFMIKDDCYICLNDGFCGVGTYAPAIVFMNLSTGEIIGEHYSEFRQRDVDYLLRYEHEIKNIQDKLNNIKKNKAILENRINRSMNAKNVKMLNRADDLVKNNNWDYLFIDTQ